MAPPKIRHELKYYITEPEYVVLRDRLLNILPLDHNADPATRQYHIRSLYFDDIFNSAMWDKMDGVQFRNKWRIRIYNLSADRIALEKKTKYDKYIGKKSALLSYGQCLDILNGKYDSLYPNPNPLLREFYAQIRTRLLKPVVIVDYYREAYLFPATNVRITFDRELCSGQFSHDLFSGEVAPVPILEPGVMILEVKYDKYLPPHVRNILQTVKGQRCAISKYAMCRQYQ